MAEPTQLSLLVECKRCHLVVWRYDLVARSLYCKQCKQEYERNRRARAPELFRRRAQEQWRKRVEKTPAYWRGKPTKPERLETIRRYSVEHRDEVNRAKREWRKRNSEKWYEIKRRSEAKRRGVLHGRISASDKATKAAYWGDWCWVCHAPWSEWDHVKPISRGGPHILSNLRPICRSCNAIKHTSWPVSTSANLGSIEALIASRR